MIAALGIAISATLTALYINQALTDGGWVKVPRKAYEFDQLPGEEVMIRGLLEVNQRRILAIPKSGEISLITEDEVDGIVAEGRKDDYDYREPGWTHVIQLEGRPARPSFEADGKDYYVIISSGTEAWKSEDVLKEYAGSEVEMIIKWDSFTDPRYPGIAVTQIRGKSIRRAQES